MPTEHPDRMKLTDPLDIARGFLEAWNDQDPDALAALFTDDADFVNVVGLWWEDRPSIRRAHARGFRVMFGGSEMTLERTKVRRLGADAAVVHALWSMTGQVDPAGSPVGDRSGVLSFVVERQPDGGWLAVAAHNTDRFPAAETLVAEPSGQLEPTSYVPRAERNDA
ncbi:YybH family protein [Tessaracoccus flavus]|nr:SgcJ/EcaC family oxidoreductase [Tessaracoccus flavus]SDY52421.1 conserved hypothetical protein [Tessaracoccus flavus]